MSQSDIARFQLVVERELGVLPPRIARLPMHDGWPVPWFVAWQPNPTTGAIEPDFRVADRLKFSQAISERKCWVCGDLLGHWLAFPLGPMCSITRTISEPPCHRECAEWSIQHCPFLSNPAMVRRIGNLPADAEQGAGAGLTRNPGVMVLWMTRTFEIFRVTKASPVGNPGLLITVGEPADVTWWCQGRPATRAEVQASIESGLPNLLAMAKAEGAFAVEELGKQVKRAEALWPAPTTR